MQALLLLGALLFSAGFGIAITRRQAVFILIGIELMLNGANLNWIIFSAIYQPYHQLFALFVMVVAVSEMAVMLAILLYVYKQYDHTNIDQLKELKH